MLERMRHWAEYGRKTAAVVSLLLISLLFINSLFECRKEDGADYC